MQAGRCQIVADPIEVPRLEPRRALLVVVEEEVAPHGLDRRTEGEARADKASLQSSGSRRLEEQESPTHCKDLREQLAHSLQGRVEEPGCGHLLLSSVFSMRFPSVRKVRMQEERLRAHSLRPIV